MMDVFHDLKHFRVSNAGTRMNQRQTKAAWTVLVHSGEAGAGGELWVLGRCSVARVAGTGTLSQNLSSIPWVFVLYLYVIGSK
jgi:hypothetical protein